MVWFRLYLALLRSLRDTGVTGISSTVWAGMESGQLLRALCALPDASPVCPARFWLAWSLGPNTFGGSACGPALGPVLIPPGTRVWSCLASSVINRLRKGDSGTTNAWISLFMDKPWGPNPDVGTSDRPGGKSCHRGGSLNNGGNACTGGGVSMPPSSHGEPTPE